MVLSYQFTVFFCVFVTGVSTLRPFPFQNQPKLFVTDGHLHIYIPEDKYVRFHTTRFHINDYELLSTLKGAENASKLMQTYERFIYQYHSKMDDIENRLLNIGTGTSNTNITNTTLRDQNMYLKYRRIDRRVTALQRTISSLKVLLNKDDCASNPCKNGGICLDMFNGFLCQCQSGWEGPTCEKDVDECTRFKGTDLGCQNGGTCQNLPGTYQCYCQNGWVGIHCTRKPTDCNSGGSEICGHGICIPQNNEAGYKCICDPGWTTDGTHKACSVDVDECKLNHPPCSTNPLVLCINVPGSFVCQHCPSGYTGNGYYCADINECQLFNGGCSVAPFVECINIPGSSKCGPCPPGYQRDGKLCSYKGICNVNNGGCSFLARCVDNPAISETYVQCLCPPGYTGSGIGPNGCLRANFNSTTCSPNPCVHGTCIINNSPQGFACVCDHKYSGTYCEREDDQCASNPCLNGGICQERRGKIVCKCKNGFSGKFCNQERQACGENIYLSNGTLSYPPTDYAFSHGSEAISCAWTITTDESMVIQINFTKFNLNSDTSCSSQWFQIHDGKNSMAPPLGRYCGSTIPLNGSVTTTHNVVYFWLRSNRHKQRPEFEITWLTKKPECGGMINGGSGMIVSPGWPSNYPKNRDCYWYFKLPTSKRLLFHIYSLNIGHDSDCTGDILEFYATNTGFAYVPVFRRISVVNKQLFANFCNSASPEPFYSTFYQGYVHFKSNDKNTYSGFQIGYTTVNGIPGCGGTYTSKDGYIQSVEMTTSMPSPLSCVYEINLPINITIKLEIVEINLDESCDSTNVAIFQGSSTDSALIGKYCGTTLPGPIITLGNHVLIQSTSIMFHKNHWKIKYEAVCTQRFTDAVNSFTASYESGECTHLIEQPVGNIILLDLELNGVYFSKPECTPFYVEVRDGDNENSTLIGRYCRHATKVKIQSSTNYLWIKARLPTSGITGFRAKYTSLDIGCGGLLKIDPGTLSFPSKGSETYSANKKCRWVILAPNDKVIQLTWMTFNLEQSFDCTYDHIEVFDNNTGFGMGGSMGKFCGYSLPPIMLSSSNIMTVDFISDTTIHGDGFLASYTFIKENHVCGANYFTSAGVIKSPGYPNNYPTNRECIWVITVSPGNQIMLNITNFTVEAYSSCRYDWLEIRNGGTSSSPLIGRYCGTTIPKLIPSHANKLYLKFNSDMSRTAQGFKIQWASAATGCGGTLTSPSGSIMSPHYPEPYTKNTDCLWKITVSAGSKIQIIFADIDLEKHSLCGLDFVQLLDGPTINANTLGKFCSQQTNPVMSTGNTMLVRFRSDVSFQGRGFNIQYSAICKNTLTGFGGVIESPNFPNDYPQDQNCVWDIIVSEKNKINVTFSHFALERSMTLENKSCQFDYVEIEYQIDSSDEPQYQKYDRYCGYTNPGLITLNSNHARIHFVSDSLLLGTGFRLEWRLFGCGGILTGLTGKITSPNYPNPYPPSVECNWIITVPLGQSIAITFTKIEVERTDYTCTYDYVKIYNGKDTSYQLLSTFCYQMKPITVTSTGNNMFVQFKADASYQGAGFIAEYKTAPTNCGGLLTAPSGFVFSPNYPKNYNKNESCEWLVTSDEHHIIQLEFEDIDLVRTNCNRTYIKVYDGPTQAYPVLETICGNTQPNKTIKSTFENLFIEFRSDFYLTSKGFKAKYQQACGATIRTSGSGTLRINKDAISSQTDGGTCTYTIQAEDKSQHVTLTITFMGNAAWCDEDGALRIYNGPFADSPLIGSYCGTKIPPAIVSDGSALHIEFTQSMDLLATYTVLDDQCGGDLLSQDGFFASPGWPKSYPNNMQCTWTISMGPGNEITLNFLNFDIPESDRCNTDFLEIRQTNATGKLLGVYCGTNMPSNLSAYATIYLLFRGSTLDEGVASINKGFKAEYAASTENKLNGTEGLIGNPHYPGPIATYGSYYWLITTKPNTRIEITFIELFMETSDADDCSGSPLKIYDCMDTEAPILLETCGYKLPSPVLSSSNMVYLTLDSYSTRLESKFLLKWKGLTAVKKRTPVNNTSDCQYIYTLEGQTNRTISSPGYPNGYAPNLNCEWIFETTPQHHIKVRFTDRNFGTWSSFRACTFADVIKIHVKSEKNGKWEIIKEICNNSNTYEEIFGTHLVKVEFTTNKYLNGSGFQAQVFTVCGGTLTEPSGYIFFNNSNFHEQECQWNISVRSGRTIKISFDEFDLTPNDPDNCRNYLIIRNGKFPDSPFLGNGKFCGPDAPPEMESTSNHIYIKYTGRISVKGFKMNYKEVSISCGQHHQLSLEVTSVEISSPNYPNIPPIHTECVWIFRAPTGEGLRVDFEERFDIYDRQGCTKDYLELRDGGTELSPLIGTYCYKTPNTQFTTDNMLRMKYFTDSDEPRNGFKAKISISYCGGTLRGTEGTLDTKVPHPIQVGSNCTWYLKAPLGYYLIIKFRTFHMSARSSNCGKRDISKVYLYEHSSIFGNDTNLGTFCGTVNTAESIKTSTNEVFVNFLSKSDQDQFSLTFEARTENCGGTLFQESGTITSPGYPNIMHEDRYCFWKIQVPKGRRISFLMEDLDFDHSYLVVFQGFTDGPKLLQIYHNDIKTEETYETSDNAAHILFWQQVQSNKRGFKMTFTSDKPSFCVGDFNQTYGEISVPLTLKPYICEWEHTKKTENETLALQVILETNVTKLGSSCRRINTGIHIFSAQSKYLGNLCKSSNENPIIFRSPYPTTALVARKNVKSELNFTITYKTYKCGAIIENEEGIISSPNFPSSPRTSMECSWLLKLHDEHKIKINITSLNLGNDCGKSYLIIYNGDTSLRPRIGKYCKNTMPDLIITQTNTALFEYKYEEGGDGSSKGFKLKYQPEIHGCGGIYQQQKNIIQTPNYSKDYPNSAECLWEIRAEDGNLIKLEFFDRFYIEESENCANDYVEIFDWKDETWVSLGKKCGRNLPQDIVSSNTQLKVLFRSNNKITGSGFTAKWDWHCGGELEASKQERYLMSPGYPSSIKANCTYKIVTKNGKGIVNIRFLDFDLYADSQCLKNNLTITGAISGTAVRANPQFFCGKNKPPNQRFKGSVIITYMNSRNFWYDASGFKLAYKDENCGGNITLPTVIEVPTTYYDTMQLSGALRFYQPKVLCSWYVTAPSNQIPVLSIQKLGMSFVPSCLVENLDVYDGLDRIYSKRLAIFCGKIEGESKPIPSNSNTMLIELQSTSHKFEGFQGEIYFTYGPSAGCGGRVNLTETKYIKSPNNLPHMDCHWTIIAPRNCKVQIEFTKINISGGCDNPVRNHTYFCTCSFIEVRDGGGPFGDQMAKLCSSDNYTHRTFTTSWNTAYVRLYSAVAQNDVFSLTLTPAQSKCGSSELTVTKELQELTSPDYPSSYPNEIKCTWVLVNPTIQGKILLHFEDFDLLEESSNMTGSCDDDRLLITDDPNRHIITEGYGPKAKYQVQPTMYYRRLAYNEYSFCGKDYKPFDHYSAGNVVTVSFKSYPFGKKGRGFKLKYGASGCNRTINANQGRIQSYSNEKYNCIITITADKNRTLSIYFLSFYFLYFDANCTNYGLEIRENNATGPQLLQSCGYRIPNPVFSNTNQLYIRAYQKTYSNHYNFLFLSSEHGKGCGGKLFNFKGRFSSPMYPNVYREEIECTWDVMVPKGYMVALKFSVFDIGGACYKNKVVVITHNSDYPTEHEFCSQDTPATLFSDVTLQVKYYSSVNNGGNGWLAEFQAVKEVSDKLLWF